MSYDQEEANVIMQNNYTALYAYIGDNPEFFSRPITVTVNKKEIFLIPFSSFHWLLSSEKLWQAFNYLKI